MSTHTAATDRHLAAGQRISGFDLARGLAVFGMVFMNFKIVMQGAAPGWKGALGRVVLIGEGRFAVLFIMLAGIGVSLMTRRARQSRDHGLLRENRLTLMRRSAFLFVTGMLFVPLWDADILHYYGIYIFLGSLLLQRPGKLLACLGAAAALAFVLLFFLLDWERGWNWHTLSYSGFWTIGGFFRHTLFNGFHPFFPWMAFFIFGMVLGRRDWSDKAFLTKGFWTAAGVFVLCEAVSHFVAPALGSPWLALGLDTVSFPPFPLFVGSSAAMGLMVIIACVAAAEKIPAALLGPLVKTGQMVLTHYLAHVILAMGLLEAMGKLFNQSAEFALFCALVYFAVALVFSHVWGSRFAKGPMETLMRQVAG